MQCRDLQKLIGKRGKLKSRFRGCFASDQFTVLPPGHFQLVNTDPANKEGEHWLLVARKAKLGPILLYDTFGRPFKTTFPSIYRKICRYYPDNEIWQYYPTITFTQKVGTSLCGIYCMYFASFLYHDVSVIHRSLLTHIEYANQNTVLRYACERLGVSLSEIVKYI